MRKLVLQMQFSVDGYVGSSHRDDWQLWNWGPENTWDEDLRGDFNAHFRSLDTILLSRKMAEEGYLAHWARMAVQRAEDPYYDFARWIGEVKKVVVTNKLRRSPWERTLIANGNLAQAVQALKHQVGGNIGVFGGAGFAQALINAELVDEFQFYINPAVLGRGTRIFTEANCPNLRLIESKPYACGMVVNRYQSLPL